MSRSGGGGSSAQRCVFVGNIPYDATEEQLTEIFASVGPVVCFRLVFDRDSGKPKGFGFCEYRDPETAMSAMRNLNGYDVNGRALRVDFAEKETKGRPGGGPPAGGAGMGGGMPPGGPGMPGAMGGGPGMPGAPGGMGGMGGPMLAGGRRQPGGPSMPAAGPGRPGGGFVPTTVPPAEASRAQVTSVLEGMSTHQLYDMVAQMKGLIDQNTEQARQILEANPQFAYALLQAELILGIVNPQLVKQLLETHQPTPAPVQPVPVQPQPVQPQMMQPMPTQPPAAVMQPAMGGPASYGGYPMQPMPSAGPMGGPMAPSHMHPPAMYGVGAPGPVGMNQPPMGGMAPAGMQPAGMPPAGMPGAMGPAGMPPTGMGMGAPPMGGMPGQPAAAGPISVDQQKLLLQQILLLTPQQIEKLPAAQREQIMLIQRQAGGLLHQPQ